VDAGMSDDNSNQRPFYFPPISAEGKAHNRLISLKSSQTLMLLFMLLAASSLADYFKFDGVVLKLILFGHLTLFGLMFWIYIYPARALPGHVTLWKAADIAAWLVFFLATFLRWFS
jgi:hypothetical protein